MFVQGRDDDSRWRSVAVQRVDLSPPLSLSLSLSLSLAVGRLRIMYSRCKLLFDRSSARSSTIPTARAHALRSWRQHAHGRDTRQVLHPHRLTSRTVQNTYIQLVRIKRQRKIRYRMRESMTQRKRQEDLHIVDNFDEFSLSGHVII